MVTREATSGSVADGPSLDEHLEAFEPYLHVGFDTLYVANMGPHYRDMIEFYGREVLPALRDAS